MRQQKTWVFNPKYPKIKVPDLVKKRVSTLADKLIDEDLRPSHVKRRRKNEKFNYIIDIYTKWVGNYFYFCALYKVPDPKASISEFEMKFARLQYTSNGRYFLAYHRHTGQWWETDKNISIARALETIKEGGPFTP